MTSWNLLKLVKNKKKGPAVHSDLGTPERRRHGPMVLEAVPTDMVTVTNRDRVRALEVDDPLYIYRRNRVVNVSQRDAGLRLRRLWVSCGLEPSVVGRYDEMVGQGSVEALRLASVDHYEQFVSALRAVGPIASDEVMSVVCLQEFIDHRRYEILRRGLDVLARHFNA